MTAHWGEVQIRNEPVLDRARAFAAGLPRPRWGIADRYLADVAAISILLAIAAFYTAAVVVPIESFIRGDWPSFFFPNYALLGERLRDFDIPGWNPAQFSGTPFVGEPSSGWGYLLAMLLYVLFAPETATVVFIGAHIALAAVATYVLARLLGLSVAGGIVAGGAYSLAWVAVASSYMVLWFGVTIWMMVSLVATELAARASSWPRRLWAWLLGGIGISQVIAAWLGQGSYYALLVIVAWIAFRTLVIPIRATSARARVQHALLTGAGVLGSGVCVVRRRLASPLRCYRPLKSGGGVYLGSSAWADRQIGFTPTELVREVLGGYPGSQWWYAGAAATALALMAPIVARRWPPLIFFTLVALGSLVLALAQMTPLHTALNVALPFFERLHKHSRERILLLYSPAVALLAGACVTYLPKRGTSPLLLPAAAAIPLVVAAFFGVAPDFAGLLSPDSFAFLIATSTLTVLYALLPMSLPRAGVLLALVVLVLWDPGGRILLRGFVDESRLAVSLRGSLTRDAGTFLHDNGAANYLVGATQSSPGRYAGYDPTHLDDPQTIDIIPPDVGYRNALA
ncbi:MAG: hypothetical protein M3Q50_05695, partial [Chloroflexota bacterium]|nr:hypothetical protein [Chloroflexota bacterium]